MGGARAVFLDRDGTINADKGYLYRIEDFEFLPGAVEGLRMLQEAGFLLVIVTNQSGIGRGYFTEEDFGRLTRWMLAELEARRVRIAGVYYCPHLPDAAVERYRRACQCRKPALGLYERAARELGIDLARSFAVGDRERDCALPGRSFLIGGDAPGARRVGSLLEAAELIVGERAPLRV